MKQWRSTPFGSDKLKHEKFVEGKQPWKVVQALLNFSGPVSSEDVVEAMKKDGYEELLNDWAMKHGGVPGSVAYHLRDFRSRGLIKVGYSDPAATPAEVAAEVEASIETTFGLERDLQNTLRKNISQLQDDLKIVDGGKERSVPSGRIDILAATSDGTLVVIELKAGEADHYAVAQILMYMGDLHEEADGKLRGILIAGDFTARAIAASKAVPNIELRRYGVTFSFQKVVRVET
jgi:hypothetical protein